MSMTNEEANIQRAEVAEKALEHARHLLSDSHGVNLELNRIISEKKKEIELWRDEAEEKSKKLRAIRRAISGFDKKDQDLLKRFVLDYFGYFIFPRREK